MGEPSAGEVDDDDDDDDVMMASAARSPSSKTRTRPTTSQPTAATPLSFSRRDVPATSSNADSGWRNNNGRSGDISRKPPSPPSLWKAFFYGPKGRSSGAGERETEVKRPAVGGSASTAPAEWERDEVGNGSRMCAASGDAGAVNGGAGVGNGGAHQATASDGVGLTRGGSSVDRTAAATSAHEPTFFERIFGVSSGGGDSNAGPEAGGGSFVSSFQKQEPSFSKAGASSAAGSTTAASSSASGDQHRRTTFSEMVDGESTAHYVQRIGGGSCGVGEGGRARSLDVGRRRGLGALAGPNGGYPESAAKRDGGNNPTAPSSTVPFSQVDSRRCSLGGSSSPLSLEALLSAGEFYPGRRGVGEGGPGAVGFSSPTRGASSARRVRLRDGTSTSNGGGFEGLSGVAEDGEEASGVDGAGAEKVLTAEVSGSAKRGERTETGARKETGLGTGGGGGGGGVFSDGARGGRRGPSSRHEDDAAAAATAGLTPTLTGESGEARSKAVVGMSFNENATACVNNSARLRRASYRGSEDVNGGAGGGSCGVSSGKHDARTTPAPKRWLSEPDGGPSFVAEAAPSAAIIGKQKSLDDLLRDMDIVPGGGGSAGGGGDGDQKRRFDDFMAPSCRSTGRTRFL